MPRKYSLNVENDEVVSVEVDGVVYATPDDIPDPEDQHRIEMMMPLSFGAVPVAGAATGVPVERIVAGVFFVVALITLSIAVFSALYIREELAREQSVPGRVTDLVARRDSDGDEIFYPVVEYVLPDGTPKRVELSFGTSPPYYAKGDAVTVLYDAEDPSDARIDSTGSVIVEWLVPLITGFIGLAFTVVTLVLVRSWCRGAEAAPTAA